MLFSIMSIFAVSPLIGTILVSNTPLQRVFALYYCTLVLKYYLQMKLCVIFVWSNVVVVVVHHGAVGCCSHGWTGVSTDTLGGQCPSNGTLWAGTATKLSASALVSLWSQSCQPFVKFSCMVSVALFLVDCWAWTRIHPFIGTSHGIS